MFTLTFYSMHEEAADRGTASNPNRKLWISTFCQQKARTSVKLAKMQRNSCSLGLMSISASLSTWRRLNHRFLVRSPSCPLEMFPHCPPASLHSINRIGALGLHHWCASEMSYSCSYCLRSHTDNIWLCWAPRANKGLPQRPHQLGFITFSLRGTGCSEMR